MPSASAVLAPARRILRPWTLLAGAVGAGVAAALLAHVGLRPVIGLITQAGYGLLAIVAFHFLQLWLTALAWGALLPRRPATSTGMLTLLRMVREGINTLLPVAQIGGPVVAIRLLCRRGLRPAEAVAGTVVDMSVELVTQIVFTLLGLAVMVRILGALPLAVPLLSGLAVCCGMVAALLAAQWLGLARFSARAAARLGWPYRIEGLHETIVACYRRPAVLARSSVFHLLAWALGAAEVWLAMDLLGHRIGLAECFVIESLGQTIRAAGFVVPGALGVQEGGYVLLCGLFGIEPDLALALSLIKRLREVAYGAPSLGIWALMERGETRSVRAPGSLPNPTGERGG